MWPSDEDICCGNSPPMSGHLSGSMLQSVSDCPLVTCQEACFSQSVIVLWLPVRKHASVSQWLSSGYLSGSMLQSVSDCPLVTCQEACFSQSVIVLWLPVRKHASVSQWLSSGYLSGSMLQSVSDCPLVTCQEACFSQSVIVLWLPVRKHASVSQWLSSGCTSCLIKLYLILSIIIDSCNFALLWTLQMRIYWNMVSIQWIVCTEVDVVNTDLVQ